VVTEVAFDGDALGRRGIGIVFEDRFAVMEDGSFVLNAAALIVGAGKDTRTAADAAVMIDQHNTVIARIAGPGWADRNARRVFAVATEGWQKGPPRIGKFAVFVFQNLRVVDVVGRIVFDLAGDGAGVAADAFLQINDHSIF